MNQHFWGKSVPCALIEPPYIAKQLSDCNLFECSAGSGSGKYIWSQHPNAGELLLPQCMQGGLLFERNLKNSTPLTWNDTE